MMDAAETMKRVKQLLADPKHPDLAKGQYERVVTEAPSRMSADGALLYFDALRRIIEQSYREGFEVAKSLGDITTALTTAAANKRGWRQQ